MRFLERLLHMALVLVGVSILIFVLVRVIPGDPVAVALGDRATPAEVSRLRAEMGLDQSLPVQYLHYVRGLMEGHFGPSLIEQRDVGPIIAERLPATLELITVAMLLAVVFGVPFGVMSAVHRDGAVDHTSRIASLFGVSFPQFWVALIFQLVLGSWLLLLPITGRISGPPPEHITGFFLLDSLLTLNFAAFSDALRHIAGPAIVLALGPLANITRLVRASMIDELGKPYPALSRAIGMPALLINYKYVLRNAFSSSLTVIGFLFPLMLGSAFVVEKVFAWPGIARFGADAIVANDFNAVVGVTLVICVFVVVINFVVDELYAVIDPRIRLGR